MAKNKTSLTGLEPINRNALVATINLAIRADRPLLILGSPGISKSVTVRAGLEAAGYAMVDTRPGNIPPEDFAGIGWPDHETKRVERYMPDIVAKCWAVHEATGKPVGLFIDEINHAGQQVQGPLYSIVLDRQSAGYPLPPGTRIIAAGNPEGTGSISEEMSRALLDRFWVVEFAGPTPDEYDAYAAAAGIHPIIRAFLQDNPTQLNAFDPDEQVSPTPRSWTDLSSVLKETSDLGEMMQAANGHVGAELGHQFAAYVEMFGQLPRFSDVVADPAAALVPDRFAARYMTGLSLVSGMTQFWQAEDGRYVKSKDKDDVAARKEIHTAVLAYMLRLPTEIQITFLTTLQQTKLDVGENVTGAAYVPTMFSDFALADVKNSAAYKELAATMTELNQRMQKMQAA
ncbi:MAG: hypothetical protein DI640_13070 [Sphingomonas taxi]|uniref:ATPase n=1 Tax=Sphingomonas taxi TaxID=1549858 RepID=A0A2W4YXR2_9SPHN|nr:MAG: hypothetical protein DI640_13070 [Sphingomonas taxi]